MVNIAELLKDAPKGMKLYSPLFGEVKLDDVGGMIYVTTKYGSSKCFTETGCYYVDNETFSTECLLFPGKGQTWGGVEIKHPYKKKFEVGEWITDGWNPPVKVSGFSLGFTYYFSEGNITSQGWKVAEENYHHWAIEDAHDGDVLATDNGWTCIFKAFDGLTFSSYCFMDSQNWFCESGSEVHTLDSRINGNIHPAAKEQRDLLFKKMKESGYTWDEKKKELKKIPKHYDIANFKPKQLVLVRDCYNQVWGLSMFSHRDMGCYICLNREDFTQCIPFDGNEKLLGTNDPCGEEFINW